MVIAMIDYSCRPNYDLFLSSHFCDSVWYCNLTRFSDVAKKQGYSVSNIDVTIPSVRFDFVLIFFVSIPIPVIDPLDIAVSITRD
jgi:hypothetical protein